MIRWFMCLLLACGGQPEPEGPAPASPSSPSVILISLDTVRADRLGVYGGRAQTPNLNKMAHQGARFEAAISNFPETALSHWAMMTGALPEIHGNVPGTGGSRFTGPTLAERLQSAGYATGAFIGGETLTDRSTGLARGFQTYDDAHAWDRQDLKRPGDQVVASAQRWMGQQQGAYFAFIHLFDAHFPYTPKAPWDTHYDPDYAGTLSGSDADLRPYRDGGKTPSADDLEHVLALYDGELSELDAIIGPVLQQAGPNTIVIVTADHGESFSHGYWFNHRDGLWDGVVRVPWLVRGAGVKPGTRVQGTVELVDMAPTVLGLLGLPPLEQIHGWDLSDQLGGAPSTRKANPAHSITDPLRPRPQLSVRTGAAKVLIQGSQGSSFDLRKDPTETRPTPLLAEIVAAARRTYDERIAPVRDRWQGPQLPSRQHSEPEHQRLESLGYIDPKDAGGGPAGAPAPH
jgi:arylsulfatase A-like enzyme